jgi:hypothetical protein
MQSLLLAHLSIAGQAQSPLESSSARKSPRIDLSQLCDFPSVPNLLQSTAMADSNSAYLILQATLSKDEERRVISSLSSSSQVVRTSIVGVEDRPKKRLSKAERKHLNNPARRSSVQVTDDPCLGTQDDISPPLSALCAGKRQNRIEQYALYIELTLHIYHFLYPDEYCAIIFHYYFYLLGSTDMSIRLVIRCGDLSSHQPWLTVINSDEFVLSCSECIKIVMGVLNSGIS